MDNPSDSKTNHDHTIDQLRETFSTEVPQELDEKLTHMLYGFQQDLREHPYFSNKKWRRFFRWSGIFPFSFPMIRFLLLTGTGLACLAIIITLFFGNKTITWADVEEQFRTIPFCSISVYYGSQFLGGHGKLQYWVSSDGRIRVHNGYKVSFIDLNKSQYIRTFDVEKRCESQFCTACKMILNAWDKMKIHGGFTVSSIIESMTHEKTIDSAFLAISNTDASNDLLVFDAESFDTLWNIRVWALRESRLPIRILKWHRHYERYEEILFSYSKEYPADFFDSDIFEAKLRDPAYSVYDLKKRFLQNPKKSLDLSPSRNY